jgi:DNA helicase-2/ATP-dependent DNA helicase PcrA
LEEERRLCFVGITRAEQHLMLTKAAVRTVRGVSTRTITSPFINEMPPAAMEVIDRGSPAFGRRRGAGGWSDEDDFEDRRNRESEDRPQFRRGQLVRHPTFGLGRITDLSDMGQDTRAVVQFNEVGRKILILPHARLEPVG